jgi:hypothetical protein
MSNKGPDDLAARFNFGGGRAAYEARVRAERKVRAAELEETLRANAATLSDEEALGLIRKASIGTVRKGEMREMWWALKQEKPA